jgi:hypothetical protein
MRKSAILLILAMLAMLGVATLAVGGDPTMEPPDWNFSTEDYGALTKGGGDLTFAPDSDWLPQELKDNIKETLKDLLDPKKDHRNTKGVSLKDFYHGHIVLIKRSDEGLAARKDFQSVTDETDKMARPKTKEELEKWKQQVELEKKTATQDLQKAFKDKWGVVYHTYEGSKPEGMGSNDPRRNIFTPGGGKPEEMQIPAGIEHYDAPNSYAGKYFLLFQFAFLVDKNGNIHVVPGNFLRLIGVTPAPKPATATEVKPKEGGKEEKGEGLKKTEKGSETPPPSDKSSGMKEKPDTSFYASASLGLGGIGPNPGLNLFSDEPNGQTGQQTTDPTTNFRVPGRLNLAATGGVGLGTWFNYPWWQLPPWLKYFGFSMNYTHYALQYGAQGGTYSQNTTFPGPLLVNTMGACTFRSTGAVNSLGFMFKGRYGWLKDEQVPFGRVQAWVGVGPSLNFVNQTPTVRFDTVTSVNGTPTFAALNGYQKFNSSSATVVGLQAAAGGSYYFCRRLSVDAFLQYDHYAPSFSLTGSGGLTGKVTIPVNQISLNLGLGLHF